VKVWEKKVLLCSREQRGKGPIYHERLKIKGKAAGWRFKPNQNRCQTSLRRRSILQNLTTSCRKKGKKTKSGKRERTRGEKKEIRLGSHPGGLNIKTVRHMNSQKKKRKKGEICLSRRGRETKSGGAMHGPRREREVLGIEE